MDSRMQARECSGLHDRGEDGRKTHKGTPRNISRHFHGISGLSLVAQAAMRLVPSLGKPCETACNNQNKKFKHTLSKHGSNKRLPDCKNKKGGCGLISRVRLLYSESCSGD